MARRLALLLLLAGLGTLAAPTLAFATTLTWTGASSHQLNDPANWSPSQAPATGDALVLTGAGLEPTSNDIPVTVQLQSLTFNNSTGIVISSGNDLALQSGGSITDNNTVVNGDDALEVGVRLNGPATFAALAGVDLRFFGAISGTGGLTLNNSTGGLQNGLVLAAANSYTGPTTITGNTQVSAQGAGRIPAGSAITVNAGATLLIASASPIGSLAGSGSVIGHGTLTVGGDDTNTSFSGVLADDGGTLSLTKVGIGTLTLSGANTYGGTTTMNAGTLRVSGSLAGAATVNGGTLDARGGTIGGTVTNSGGTLVGDAPGPPTGAGAVRGDAQATVSFTAPVATGSSAITSYTVTSSLGDVASGTGTSIAVTGLTNGTSYTFTVKATNAFGTSAASTATAAVTPAAVPGAPSGVSATAGDARATVSWSAAAANGSAITGYTVTAAPGGRTCTTVGALSCAMTGLTNGTSYTFTVTATNGVGTGAASAASPAVTPRAPETEPAPEPSAPPPVTVAVAVAPDVRPPTAPAGLSGRFAGGSLLLSWQPAADDVGVVAYEIELGGVRLTSVPAAQLSARVRTFARSGPSVYTVRSIDAAGNRSQPLASVTVTPAKRPASVPKAVPRWAWNLLAWQLQGSKGARPASPRHLPRWYAAWRTWRLAPFAVASS